MAARSAGAGGAPAHVAVGYPLVPQVSPHFSLARVASEHSGLLRVRRLLFIAERCPPLSVEAFRLALQSIKSAQPQRAFANPSQPAQLSAPAALGPSATLYAEAIKSAHALLLTPSNQADHAYFLSAAAAGNVAADPLFQPDQNMYNNLQAGLDSAARALEAQLAQQKRDGEREGIKTALLNLAELYLNRGEINHALNKFMEAKEFVTPQSGPQQASELLHLSLSLIRASILSLSLSHVKTQVQRALRIVKDMQQQQQQQQGGGAQGAGAAGADSERELAVISSKLHAAHGLFHLKNGAYHSAAHSFALVTSDLGSSYNDVLSSADVVAYASLTALASFSRAELKELLQHNAEFRKLLDTHAPNTFKPLLNHFHLSNYAKVFEILDTIKSDLLLDLFLSPHVHRLVKSIRERAFLSYLQAYATVSLPSMAAAFSLPVPTLERALAELIAEGKAAARIDAQRQLLHGRHADARHATYGAALQLGGRYAADVRALLLRLSLAQADMAVRNSAAEGKRGKAQAQGAGPGAAAAGGAVGVAPDGFAVDSPTAGAHGRR